MILLILWFSVRGVLQRRGCWFIRYSPIREKARGCILRMDSWRDSAAPARPHWRDPREKNCGRCFYASLWNEGRWQCESNEGTIGKGWLREPLRVGKRSPLLVTTHVLAQGSPTTGPWSGLRNQVAEVLAEHMHASLLAQVAGECVRMHSICTSGCVCLALAQMELRTRVHLPAARTELSLISPPFPPSTLQSRKGWGTLC